MDTEKTNDQKKTTKNNPPTTVEQQVLVFIAELSQAVEAINAKLDLVLAITNGKTYSRSEACAALGVKRDQLESLIEKGILIQSTNPQTGLPYKSARFTLEAIINAQNKFALMGKPKRIRV